MQDQKSVNSLNLFEKSISKNCENKTQTFQILLCILPLFTKNR